MTPCAATLLSVALSAAAAALTLAAASLTAADDGTRPSADAVMVAV